MGPQNSSLRSQQPGRSLYAVEDESSPYSGNLISLKSILILPSYLSVLSRRRIFPSDLPTKTLYALLISRMSPT